MNLWVALALLAVPPQQVTFEAARSLAELQAPDVALAQLRSAVAGTEVSVASALANPTLTVSSATQSAKLSTGVSVPLPLFGQRGTARSAAQADANVALLEVKVARREARRAATVAWVDLWEAQQRSNLRVIAAFDAQRVLDVAREKFDAGTGAKVDLLRTRADQALAAANADAATHDVAAASTRLAVLLGAEASLIAAGEPGFGEIPVELTIGLGDHPALMRDREAVSAAEAHLISERRQRWPMLNAQFAVNQFDQAWPVARR